MRSPWSEGEGIYTDLTDMLLADYSHPLASGTFFINGEVKPAEALPNLFNLVVKNAGKDGDGMRFQNATKVGNQRHDHIRRQVTHHEIDAIRSNSVQRTTERPDLAFAVAFDVGTRYLQGNGIDVTREDFCRPEQRGCNRENAG